jgi:hypothetical protein
VCEEELGLSSVCWWVYKKEPLVFMGGQTRWVVEGMDRTAREMSKKDPQEDGVTLRAGALMSPGSWGLRPVHWAQPQWSWVPWMECQ